MSMRKAAIVAVIVLSAITAGYFLVYQQNCPLVTIVPTGTVLSVQPGAHVVYNFTVTKVVVPRIVTLDISSDNGIVLYLMTPSQYSGYNSTGNASSHMWTSGQITSLYCGGGKQECSLGPTIPSVGGYYFVISNPSTSLVARVTVNTQVQVGPC